MSYSKGPYQSQSSLPSPGRTTLVGSRAIDFVRREYLLTDDGNLQGMQGTRQRVFQTLDFAMGPPPKFQTTRDLEARRKNILTALDGLIDEGVIKDVDVEMIETANGGTTERVTYTDVSSEQLQTVVVWP